MPKQSEDYLAEILQRQQDGLAVRCPVTKFLTEVKDDRVKEGVEQALRAPQIYATTIAAVITENGTECGEKAVRSHRRGVCACSRRTS